MAAATEELPYGTITEDAPPESYITLVSAANVPRNSLMTHVSTGIGALLCQGR